MRALITIGIIQVRVTQCLNPDKSCGGGDLVLEDYDTYCHQVVFSLKKKKQVQNLPETKMTLVFLDKENL